MNSAWYRNQKASLLTETSTCINISILKILFSVILLLISLTPDVKAATEDSSDVVTHVVQLYETGRISEAEYAALKGLESPADLSPRDQFNLNKILAFCSIANDDELNAIRYFDRALRLNPGMTPDPITWSPKVRQVFQRAREEFDKQRAIEKIFKASNEATLGRKASFKSLYFPGAGQFTKGQRGRGFIVGTLFFGIAATFVYSQVALPELRDKYREATVPAEIAGHWENYRDMYRLNRASGMLTIAVYTYAFFDALWSESSQTTSKKSSE